MPQDMVLHKVLSYFRIYGPYACKLCVNYLDNDDYIVFVSYFSFCLISFIQGKIKTNWCTFLPPLFIFLENTVKLNDINLSKVQRKRQKNLWRKLFIIIIIIIFKRTLFLSRNLCLNFSQKLNYLNFPNEHFWLNST